MRKITFLALSFFLMAAVWGSCQYLTKKDAPKGTPRIESQTNELATNQKSQKTPLDSIANFTQLKKYAEAKIANYDKRITDLKLKISESNKENKALLEKQLDVLEKKNNEMKKKLASYTDEGQTKWEGFKNELNKDIDALGEALANFVD